MKIAKTHTTSGKKSCYSGVRNKKNVCMLWQIWNSLTLQRAKPTSSVSLGETQYIVVIIISSRWCPSLFLSRDHQLLHRCSHSPPCVWRPGANEASPTVCFLASFVVLCVIHQMNWWSVEHFVCFIIVHKMEQKAHFVNTGILRNEWLFKIWFELC